MQQEFTITFNEKEYRQVGSQPILSTLLKGQEALEYQCREGYCGACRLILVEGEVTYRHDPIALVREGDCLPCCCAASSDVELKRPL